MRSNGAVRNGCENTIIHMFLEKPKRTFKTFETNIGIAVSWVGGRLKTRRDCSEWLILSVDYSSHLWTLHIPDRRMQPCEVSMHERSALRQQQVPRARGLCVPNDSQCKSAQKRELLHRWLRRLCSILAETWSQKLPTLENSNMFLW
jgi:hypothetical protein